ncbi:MAG: proline--tRNA ligase [Deltaproteobacteria bacterium]|nr:proline--tRNA ligase [Deltaproteobacteria bacterium]
MAQAPDKNTKAPQTAITPTRAADYPEWYQQVVKAADLAEVSPVRGCMVIKPWGYAIWENIQKVLDGMFKATGHVNAYFPLFIPKSFLEKEAEHVEGFAKECAVVTHHRLEAGPNGGLVPAGELEEPLVVRPTSETIIGAMFAQWVQSYRDLPLLINQWANVVRWELRTRLFLRTAEFLWQEGHTCHATAEEAMEETRKMLDVYATFARDFMAMPVIPGEKTAAERFPGAVATYTIEAMMQDRKALQAGTSHFLGQNFARAQDIKFQSKTGALEHCWTTSWGVSTRLVGAIIMSHSDDDGLVLPPRLAPTHVVIVPVFRKEDERAEVLAYCDKLAAELGDIRWAGIDMARLVVKVDKRDLNGGEKSWEHIKKGVPVRLEIGPRDIAKDSAFMGRRDKAPKDKESVTRGELVARLPGILDEIQGNLYQRALAMREGSSVDLTSAAELRAYFADDQPGGFGRAFAADVPDYAEELKGLKVSARCMPIGDEERGTCIFTGRPDARRIVFARSY